MMKKTIVGIIILMVVQMACGFIAPAPTATPTPSPTSLPPTATATSIPPTVTETSIPPTDTPEPATRFLADSSLVSIMFTVVNESGESLDLSWVDWQGNRGGTVEKYATIPAGGSYQQQSYFADAWILHDGAGNSVLFFFATEDDGRIITISAEAVALAKANAFKDKLHFGTIPGSGDLPISDVRFVNNSNVDLLVFWIDSEEQSQSVGTIQPSGNLEVEGLTFGGMISVTDADGNVVLFYVATETQAQTVTLSASAVAYRFGITR